MVRQDDRTPEQRATHRWAVVGRDSFLSGWGGAEGGYSRAAWAVAPDANIDRVENWVRSRGDMKYVAVVDLNTYRPPRGTAHFHIYVVEPGHAAAGVPSCGNSSAEHVRVYHTGEGKCLACQLVATGEAVEPCSTVS